MKSNSDPTEKFFCRTLLKKFIAHETVDHIRCHNLTLELPLTYRKFHNTKTVLLEVHTDILINMNNQQTCLNCFS